jgi:hypothetical protein
MGEKDTMALSWLPTKEEARKLAFEAWKYLLSGALGIAALFVPAVRGWLFDGFDVLARYSASTHTFSGKLALMLMLCAAFTAVCLLFNLIIWFGPRYLRQFRQAEYNGMIWNWRWKRSRVLKSSMRAMCVKCGTELRVSVYHTAYAPETHIYCTTCNEEIVITNCNDLKDHIWRKIEADVRSRSWEAAQNRVPEQYRA